MDWEETRKEEIYAFALVLSPQMLLLSVFTTLVLLIVSSSVLCIVDDMQPKLLYEPNAPDYRSSEIVRQSLFDKLAVDASLSTFMDVLTQVENVLKMVNNSEIEQPFTLFCPVNGAFQASLLEWRTDNLQDWEKFLQQHLVPTAKLDVRHLKKTQQLDTMVDDQPIHVKYHYFRDKTDLNNGMATVDTDHPIEAANGIAYKIDAVLRPVQDNN
ncbi:hypothetical protein O0I10_011029 [Lichtheimia ornata]|uniref:FAS1 domain-containing protein n=1 Tax=Lichtheimia ornata TaxID=688661 RepID=A0AAD7UVI1_9FUNG|nr:uncharacterized protein O0I10_011029 [Lichtheimia ornata]KAJ8653280.1 hypothetical protein O0I10_011029 [Lichtheimia ornata]